MKSEDNRLLVITLVVSIIILIGVVVAGTYAFFTATIKQNEDADFGTGLTAGNIEFSLTGGDSEIVGGNLIPGEEITKTFQVKNDSSGTITYRLVWESVTNNLVNQDDLIVILSDGLNEIISENDHVTLPSTTTEETDLKTGLKISSGETKNFTLKIKYLNTEFDQTEDIGKTFRAKLKISD